MVAMTNFLLLIGAGLFSKAVGAFQENAFNKLYVYSTPFHVIFLNNATARLGADVDDAGAAGDGPGSYDVRGNVWHLNCCNPESKFDNSGWTIFNAIFGWTNNATIGTVLSYVFYWLAVIVVLIFLKYKEVILHHISYVVKRLTPPRRVVPNSSVTRVLLVFAAVNALLCREATLKLALRRVRRVELTTH